MGVWRDSRGNLRPNTRLSQRVIAILLGVDKSVVKKVKQISRPMAKNRLTPAFRALRLLQIPFPPGFLCPAGFAIAVYPRRPVR